MVDNLAKRPSLSSIIIGQVIHSLLHQPNSSGAQQERWHQENVKWTRRTFWAVVVYSFLTAVIALASIGAAMFAGKGNVISREAFTSVQRAFVTVSSFDTPTRSDYDGKVKYFWFIPNVKNSGNTPTKNLKYFITATCPPELSIGIGAHMALACDFTRQPEGADPEDLLKVPTFKDKIVPALLGPQAVLSLGGIGVTERSMQAIQKGFPLFLSGIVYYNDIFPGSPLHVTKFCYQMQAFTSDKQEGVSSYTLCNHWNCADDECKTDRADYDAGQAALARQQKPAPPPPSPPAK